jgi:hypothetical protein
MRVNCDVCGGEPAAVLCCADEAALCSACDRRVHRANKLASKHRRIPLLHPDATGPLCDVCKVPCLSRSSTGVADRACC